MKIWTEIEEVDGTQTKVGVHIERTERPKLKDIPDFMNFIMSDLIDTMEISSILKALHESNEKAFNVAMEHFIEEELSDGESVC